MGIVEFSTKDTAARQLRLLGDAQLARAIQVAATLGVADHVDEPKPARELAEHTLCDPDALRRLLRYLAFAGVFAELPDGRFALTPMARLLRSDEPDSLRARLTIGPDNRAVWWSTGELLHSVRTGGPAYDRVYGQSLWATLLSNADSSSRFQEGMAEHATTLAGELLTSYDWSTVGTVADLGGGGGVLLTRLLHANPRLRGLLVDTPAACAGAEQTIAAAGLAERCQVAPADLFTELPAGADVYLLARVLHNWPDEAAARILRNCRHACGDTGRLLVVDMEVGPNDRLGESHAGDMLMLLLVGGRERTWPEFTELFALTGFCAIRKTELAAPYVAIEATPR